MKIEKIYISPDFNYRGKGKDFPGDAPTESVGKVQCDAGKGLVGDRYYGWREDFKGQVTFIWKDYLDQMMKDIDHDFPYEAVRRNILVSGMNPLDLVGKKFRIGTAVFEGTEDCTPCGFWSKTIKPGASEWLIENNAGGLRAKVVESGEFSVGDQMSLES